MRNFLLILLTGSCTFPAFAQRQLKGVVADSLTKQALPFATIRPGDQPNSFITGINGQFSFVIPAGVKQLHVSYISYRNKTIVAGSLNNNDTIFLSPLASTLGEVIVRPQIDKIRRIVNTAIRNKPSHNPEKYELYQCNIYYKMKLDVEPYTASVSDSNKINRGRDTLPKSNLWDSLPSFFRGNNHLFFSETYSRRFYKRPQQVQEIILAERTSGFKKSYFSNLVTNVLPFHVYSDYITLNNKDYINPVAKGWQQRYNFYLADEISNGEDTTFILTFKPKKNVGFNSLKGVVYINTNGYAISHFIATTTDSVSHRVIKIEQVYTFGNEKWFPRELNYDFAFKGTPSQPVGIHVIGHSMIDSALFTRSRDFKLDKAYSVIMHDSVDLRSEEEWQKFRMDSLTVKERNTYRVIDSLSEKEKLEQLIVATGKLAIGRLQLGGMDIDVTRLVATNKYEGFRLGAGLYTNDKVSEYFSVGGWFGYGFKDKTVKYGFSGTVYPGRNKDNWLSLSYRNDYQNAGNVFIHPEIDRSGYRTWLLAKVDRVREYSIKAHAQKGYWEIEMTGMKQKLASKYENNFEFAGKNYTVLDAQEAGIGLRYSYGQKRAPVFGNYLPLPTRYPIVYFRTGVGTVQAGDYKTRYIRSSAAITFNKHLNRWGNNAFRIEAALIHSFDNKPLSRSFMLGAKGFRREGVNYYAWGGFLTMRPYDYFSDKYVSLLYRHDFDKFLWQRRYSKPFISFTHNVLYGSINEKNKTANPGIVSPVSGYHESGILLNQLIQINVAGAYYLYLNAGAFYHWAPVFDWQKNGVWMIGLSAGF